MWELLGLDPKSIASAEQTIRLVRGVRKILEIMIGDSIMSCDLPAVITVS